MLIRARITHTEFVARATHTHSSCDTQPPNYTCKAHAKLWLLSLASKFLFPSVSSSPFFCAVAVVGHTFVPLCTLVGNSISTLSTDHLIIITVCQFESYFVNYAKYAVCFVVWLPFRTRSHTHTQRTWVAKCVSQFSRHAIMTHVNFWRCAPVINRFLSYAATLVMLLHVC